MTGTQRTWAVRRDGEILFQIVGPDAQAMVRAAACAQNGVLIYRDDEKPTAANGWQLHGPWQDADPSWIPEDPS